MLTELKNPPHRSPDKNNRAVAFVGMALLYLILAFGPFGDHLNMLGYDATVSRLPTTAATERPVLIEIDDRSLALMGRWPWQRADLAQLVARVDAAGASAIALDVLIAEAADAANDRALIETARIVDNLIMPVVGNPIEPNVPVGLWPPLLELVHHAHTEATVDSNGSVRWAEASKRLGDQDWPAMAVALSGTQPPVDRFLFPFPDPAPFERISAVDVFAGNIERDILSNKLALIGVTAMGTARTFVTPTATAVTGIELQAFQTAALLNRGWWQFAPWPGRVVLWSGLLAVTAAILQIGAVGLLAVPLLGLFSFLLSRLALQMEGWWLAPTPALLAMTIGAAAWLAIDWQRHRRATEIERARASATLAAMADAVIATDHEDRVVVVNDAAERMCTCSREEMLGRKIGDIAELSILASVASGPVEMRTADGGSREVLVSSGRIDGEVGGAAYVLHDVSDRERAARALALSERERLAAERRLQAARRMSAVAEVSAAIAHELNQPLAALTTYAATAKLKLHNTDLGPSTQLTELVDKIANQASRSANVVKKLRGVFEQARTPNKRRDLHQTVHESLILAESELDLPASCIRLHLATKLPPVAHDPLQIQQLLLNLLRNAIDAKGSISDLQIDISSVIANGSKVRLAVEDNGPGIDPATRAEIFEPLASTKQNGLGIGLSISRSIAEAHGGTLSIEASAFGGAKFVLSVPHKN